MDVLDFGSCTVRIFEDAQYLETVFHDGTKVSAAPQDNDSYRGTANRLGYADPWALCREHELSHTRLMQMLGLAYSPTMWAVAHGATHAIPGSPGEMWAEEELVMSYQRWLNLRSANDR